VSAFSPIDVRVGSDRRQRLIDKLLQQYGAAAQRAQGLGQAGLEAAIATGLPFHGAFRTPAIPGGSITRPFPGLPPGLLDLLGPAGGQRGVIGRDFSAGPGQALGIDRGAQPHAIPVNPGAGHGAPIPAAPIAPSPAPAAPAAAPAPTGLVPVGNGLYYDPVSGGLVARPSSGGVQGGTTAAPSVGGGRNFAV